MSAARAPVDDALGRVAREEGGRILAILARRLGDVGLAEEAVQDALLEAARTWPSDGVPKSPGGWLARVARRRALDRLRRADAQSRRIEAAAHTTPRSVPPEELLGEPLEAKDDEELRLLFLCCHPALDRPTQVTLTLRLAGGLTTQEIAHGLLLQPSAVGQRISRAKRKIRDAAIPLALPERLEERLPAVLEVLYLVFNEGYLASRAPDALVRLDLMDEALRLTARLARLLPGEAEVLGLLALEHFHRARADARTDPSGAIVLLEDQDRSRFRPEHIRAGNEVLWRAMRTRRPGPYQLQAAIAGIHANAPSAEATDWKTIRMLYDALLARTPSAVVRLNRAVAHAMVEGPQAGLEALDAIEGLEGYHLFHASRGELLRRAGRPGEAREAFVRAHAATENGAERRLLEARLAALGA